ncbi:hypothetical protein C8Q77DRAFT_508503 [Trametes polyzona]|nr:hypothetical protein C8Q77DRAFT_508503 [Trametes polyzona]
MSSVPALHASHCVRPRVVVCDWRAAWGAQNRRRTWGTCAPCTYMGPCCLRRPAPISPRLGSVCQSLHLPLESLASPSPRRRLARRSLPFSLCPRSSRKNFTTKMAARGCFNCGGFGHQAANCPKAGTPTCYNCGAGRRATSPGSALKTPTPPAAATSPRSAAVTTLARSATAAARSAISHGRALRPPVVRAALAEATTASVAASRGHGTRPCDQTRVRLVNLQRYSSYTCGGVGHLSRDCVQGSKCYNCSGFVSPSSLIFVVMAVV